MTDRSAIVRLLHNPWLIAIVGGAFSTIAAGLILSLILVGDGDEEGRLPANPGVSASPSPTGSKTSPPVVAEDGFESSDWEGGQGWLGGWVCIRSAYGGHDRIPCGDGDPMQPEIIPLSEPHAGNYHLHFRSTAYRVQRAIDLSGHSEARLRLWVRVERLQGNSFAFCEVSPDGEQWSRVVTWTPGSADVIYEHVDVDLSDYEKSDSFWVACEASSGTDSGPFWADLYLDDITVVEE